MKKTALLLFFFLNIFHFATSQEISPYLFGQNHWIGDGDEGRSGYIHLLWPKIEESGIKMVRIGGNNYNDKNHALFARDRKKLNSILDSIRKIGAEPYFQIPVGKGRDYSFTAKEAADFVKEYKYLNGKGIRYYALGNEPLLHDREGIQKVYDFIVDLAPAMKAADPSIKIFVFDECDLFVEAHERIIGGDLDVTGKDKNGNWMVDGIAFHRYPGARSREQVVFGGPNDIRKKAERLQGMMDVANKKHGRTGDAKLLWGLTEFNVTTNNPDREITGIGNTSFLGGQFMAEIYGIGMEYGAFTMTPWCISETDALKTDFGYLGMPMDFLPRSSYYHTQMMALNMKGKFLPTVSNTPYVTTIGSQSDDEICIMILNRDQYNNYDFDIILNKEDNSNKPLIIRANLGLDKVIKGTIQNQTTLMYVLNKNGGLVKTLTYGLQQNLKYLPPQEVFYKSPDAFTQNKRLGRGVNIIGYDPFWKSMENSRFQKEHFKIIKEGGFNGIRVNIHPFKFMDKENNYQLPPSWFDKLDWVLDNALANNLMIILDFHEFNSMAENPKEKKDIFLRFWGQVAPHCKYLPSNVMFELLNEPNGQLTPELWNEFLKEALAIVRETNPNRTVIIGPAFWNQIPHLEELELPEDDRNIIVTIHYYNPHEFTHQGAPWAGEKAQLWIGNKWGSEEDKAAVRKDFQIAKDWSVKNNRPIFLGEFGVYDKAPMEYRVIYTSYVARLAEEFGFSWAYWQFDSDFILYDIDNGQWIKPIHRALIPSER
jgi:endoglucanase